MDTIDTLNAIDEITPVGTSRGIKVCGFRRCTDPAVEQFEGVWYCDKHALESARKDDGSNDNLPQVSEEWKGLPSGAAIRHRIQGGSILGGLAIAAAEYCAENGGHELYLDNGKTFCRRCGYTAED